MEWKYFTVKWHLINNEINDITLNDTHLMAIKIEAGINTTIKCTQFPIIII